MRNDVHRFGFVETQVAHTRHVLCRRLLLPVVTLGNSSVYTIAV